MKWIFKYLKGTKGYSIMLRSKKVDPLIVVYVDLDYVGDMEDRRSTTWYAFSLAG